MQYKDPQERAAAAETSVAAIYSLYAQALNNTAFGAMPACTLKGTLFRGEKGYYRLKDGSGEIDVKPAGIDLHAFDGMEVAVAGTPCITAGSGKGEGKFFLGVTVFACSPCGRQGEACTPSGLLEPLAGLLHDGRTFSPKTGRFPPWEGRAQKLALVAGSGTASRRDVLGVFGKPENAGLLDRAGVVLKEYDVRVSDERDIARGIAEASRDGADILMLVRGGGPEGDLRPFSRQCVLDALSKFKGYSVTGIGHAPDATLCDLVASAHYATPTEAAEEVARDLRARIEGWDLSARMQSLQKSAGAGEALLAKAQEALKEMQSQLPGQLEQARRIGAEEALRNAPGPKQGFSAGALLAALACGAAAGAAAVRFLL